MGELNWLRGALTPLSRTRVSSRFTTEQLEVIYNIKYVCRESTISCINNLLARITTSQVTWLWGRRDSTSSQTSFNVSLHQPEVTDNCHTVYRNSQNHQNFPRNNYSIRHLCDEDDVIRCLCHDVILEQLKMILKFDDVGGFFVLHSKKIVWASANVKCTFLWYYY